MSLVADYGNSSGSEEEENDSMSSDESYSPTEPKDLKNEEVTTKLPKPDFIDLLNTSSSSKTSVFTNPFKQAEEAKQAILEKHVKMVSTQDNIRSINGKKVCWNYRKGKCRFGHNCIYAHDSDVQKTAEQIDNEHHVQQTILCQSQEFQGSKPEEESDLNKSNKAKKRPGLTQGLVPGKKIMKNYHRQSTMLLNKNK